MHSTLDRIFRDISNKEAPFFLMAGPCVLEDEQMGFAIAEHISGICKQLHIPYIFKASYKKANRTRLDSFTGIGDAKAIDMLHSIGKQYDIPVVTDVHTAEEASMAGEHIDVLQIPAFLCRQTDLLLSAGQTGRVVNIKKGQFLSPQAMQFAAEKVESTGNSKVMLTERGTSFGYGDLVVDFRSIPLMKAFHKAVVLDVTHSLQQPSQGQGVTGGLPHLIETIAMAGMAAGADGIFIETHPDPSNARSDGANMLKLEKLEALLEKLIKIREAIR